LIGQLWQRLYRGAKRIEEDESSDDEEDGNEKPSADQDQDK